jgi:hypothetical protein
MPQRRIRTRFEEVDPEADAVRREPEEVVARTPADAILAMQRGSGNASVQRYLSTTQQPKLAREKTKKKPAWKDDIQKAVSGAEYQKAVLGLWAVNEEDIAEILKGISDEDLEALAGTALASTTLPVFGPGMASVYRHISFAMHDPGKTKAHKPEAKTVDAGDLGVDAQVGGGRVRVHTNAQYKPVGSNDIRDAGFTLDYKGKDSEKTHWMQFIWREIHVEHPVTGNAALTDTITTSGGTYQLTDDPTKPHWNTDGADADPFYESDGGGYNNRSKDSTTIFDFPSPMNDKVRAQIDGGATKVTSRAHFSTYLVRDMEIMLRVDIDIEWVFTSRDIPPRVYTVNSEAAQALDPEIRKVLIAQFPNFDFFP